MNVNVFFLCLVVAMATSRPHAFSQAGDWVPLFDGKTLNGWKASENDSSFRVVDGCIVHDGPRSHLYYVGEVAEHQFTDFEFKAMVYTFANANSGIYFHTRFQEKGFPNYGYEVQVNNSHRDIIRTGSLYNIIDVADHYALDEEWFELYVRVEGRRVIVKVDGITVVDYTELDDKSRLVRRGDHFGRFIGQGTFAIQAHDANSKVMYKDIQVRLLNSNRSAL